MPQTLAGIALIPAIYLLRPLIGKRMAFIAAVLVTLSPSMLYFARYARHDALMLLWTLFLFTGLFRWFRSGRTGDLVLAAVGLALAWATHELVFILIFIVGTFLIFRGSWEWRPEIRGQRPNLFMIAVQQVWRYLSRSYLPVSYPQAAPRCIYSLSDCWVQPLWRVSARSW